MGLIALLGNTRVTDAKINVPGWGAIWADVSLDTEITLSGKVTLQIADLTIQAAILSGGPAKGRSFYRLMSGAGGWATELPARSYTNDAGNTVTKVLGDAAASVGETLDPSTLPTTSLGNYFVRPADLACRLLEQISPGAWRIDADGITRLGARPATTFSQKTTETTRIDLARGTVTLAGDTIAALVPGLAYPGLGTVVDVEHTLDASGLRSTLYAQRGAGNSRVLSAFRAMLEQLDPDRLFRGIYEFRILKQNGERLDLQPVRTSLGLPSILRVRVRPGVPGVKAVHKLGARVVVGWLNADPTQPIVIGFPDAEDSAFLPTSLALAGGGAGVARNGDDIKITVAQIAAAGLVANLSTGAVTAGSDVAGNVSSGSSKVTSG